MNLDFGAAEAVRRLRAKEFSSTELVQALLDRIEEINPKVNAITTVLAEKALAASRLPMDGPLAGLPISVKDNIDVAGLPTTHGVPALADAIAKADAPAIAHLRKAGAIPLARTNMPDFALRWHTDSGIAGPTLNPWDPTLTPGGSSAGEAVSLATGMSLLGVGTDFGGSLRWPSQCAGTAALRPTLGRIAKAETTAMSLQLMDVEGPMAHKVEDLRLAFQVMSGPDRRDPWHVPTSYVPHGPSRIHAMTDDGLQALAANGYTVVDEPPPGIDEAARCWAQLMATDARRVWPTLAPMASESAKTFMAAMFDLVPAIGLDEYAELFTTRQRLLRAWAEYQWTTPLVLAPIYAGRPFKAGEDLTMAAKIVDNLKVTLAVSFLGLPAVAVPVSTVPVSGDGPHAVQVIGPRFGEELCLRAAEIIERDT